MLELEKTEQYDENASDWESAAHVHSSHLYLDWINLLSPAVTDVILQVQTQSLWCLKDTNGNRITVNKKWPQQTKGQTPSLVFTLSFVWWHWSTKCVTFTHSQSLCPSGKSDTNTGAFSCYHGQPISARLWVIPCSSEISRSEPRSGFRLEKKISNAEGPDEPAVQHWLILLKHIRVFTCK